MEITIKSDNYKEEGISAFSYNLGKLIEEVIKEETNNLKDNNKLLEAKLLHWNFLYPNPEFTEFFGIITETKGSV